jgi:hypothetical protein
MKATFSLASYDLLNIFGSIQTSDILRSSCNNVRIRDKNCDKAQYIVPVPQRIILLGKATYRLHR